MPVGVQKKKDLADPALRDKHTDPDHKDSKGKSDYQAGWGYTKAGENPKNKLFYYGVKVTDVYQGKIADCYFVAALAATAGKHPSLIKEGIVDNGDGTYKVRFFQKENYYATDYKETWVTVDGDLPSLNKSEEPGYAKGQKTRTGGRELWPSIYEKGYAQLKGGYNKMGEGGSSTGALESLIGARAERTSTAHTPEDVMWKKLQSASAAGQAMTAGTHGKDQAELYAPPGKEHSGLYPWHAYTVMGVSEVPSSNPDKPPKRWVKIRNPWGRVEYAEQRATSYKRGGDKDEGIFEMELADFMKFYSSVNIANLPS